MAVGVPQGRGVEIFFQVQRYSTWSRGMLLKRAGDIFKEGGRVRHKSPIMRHYYAHVHTHTHTILLLQCNRET